MKIGILFPDLPLKTGWIFPHEGKDVPLTDYHDDLVTQPQIESLMAAMPWEILSTNSGSAISLHNDMGGRLGLFLGAYRQFETKHRMALWEGTHKFPIPRPKIAKSAWLADFNKKRGNRRSHAGADWKKILVIFILTMQMGWCIPTSRQDTRSSPQNSSEVTERAYRWVHKVRKVQQITDHRRSVGVWALLEVGSCNLADFADPAPPQWCACPDLFVTRDFTVSPKKMFK
ncbi:hypothetical protein PC129_g10864 [Phytophthora cactorum]|uniref:Uncharacterized protein n=1 Tax=Phytophthora cactorum TaxID=29920 RepID=A0A8T1I0E7_9STRA|nr:hypothetical protein PC112_g8897 [Phytophthora cactorum]KAG3026758.1 hypothetical protein PC119_g7651 [Phytophthora cactorum]KAG3218330.1 hypothetical protein PC129_g10864 [Phytophthora cactorum]